MKVAGPGGGIGPAASCTASLETFVNGFEIVSGSGFKAVN